MAAFGDFSIAPSERKSGPNLNTKQNGLGFRKLRAESSSCQHPILRKFVSLFYFWLNVLSKRIFHFIGCCSYNTKSKYVELDDHNFISIKNAHSFYNTLASI